jgi:putative PIN family toxin of toxin-antitoxin system
MNEKPIIMDTNVLLSGLRSQKGQSNKLLQKLYLDEVKIAISVPLVLEYESVLKRELNRSVFTEEDIDVIINYICMVGIPIKIFYLWRPFLKDPYDDHVLEVAIAANCDYIVTYNKKDFKEAQHFGIKAVTPYEYLVELEGTI